MRRGLKFLNKTDDSLLHPAKLRHPLRVPTTADESRDWLRGGTLSEQVLTLWQLDKSPLPDRALIDAIESKLFDRNWAVVVSAACALGSTGKAACSSAPVLLELLSSDHSGIRAACAAALGQIQAEPETTIPHLTHLLGDIERGVVTSAGFALGQFGPAAQEASTALLRAIDSALYRHGTEQSVAYLVNAFCLIDPEPMEHIQLFYEDGNDEHRDHLLEMIDDLQQTATPS
jgi:HEAT repeat protein